jgi:hypothetical protein
MRKRTNESPTRGGGFESEPLKAAWVGSRSRAALPGTALPIGGSAPAGRPDTSIEVEEGHEDARHDPGLVSRLTVVHANTTIGIAQIGHRERSRSDATSLSEGEASRNMQSMDMEAGLAFP